MYVLLFITSRFFLVWSNFVAILLFISRQRAFSKYSWPNFFCNNDPGFPTKSPLVASSQPSIFSIEIVERAYKNKNGEGFIHRTALALFERYRIVENLKKKTSVDSLNHLFLDQNSMNCLFRDFHALSETRLLNNHSLHSEKKRTSYILERPLVESWHTYFS